KGERCGGLGEIAESRLLVRFEIPLHTSRRPHLPDLGCGWRESSVFAQEPCQTHYFASKHTGVCG
ncbi:hypothetical protein AVEN_114296-1, partial [Araneus ventricosus]